MGGCCGRKIRGNRYGLMKTKTKKGRKLWRGSKSVGCSIGKIGKSGCVKEPDL